MKTLNETHLVSGAGPAAAELRCFKILNEAKYDGKNILDALNEVSKTCPNLYSDFIRADKTENFAQLIKDVCEYHGQNSLEK